MRTIIAILLTLFAGTVLAAGERELTAQAPVDGVRQVAVSAEVGSIDIAPATDTATVSVKLKLEAVQHGFWFVHWRSREAVEAVQKAQIELKREGDVLHCILITPQKTSGDDLKEHWTVKVPPALAAKLRLKVGSIHVKGISGGLDAEDNVGSIHADLPGGPVRASANVGKVELKLAQAPGKVSLRSNVGKVGLTMGGESVGTPETGGAGESLDYAGSGAAPVDVSVNVGRAEVEVSAPSGDAFQKADQAEAPGDPGDGTG